MPFRINPFTGTLSPVIEDVAESNTRDILYIKGDEFTDGSIRIQFTTPDTNSHIERRASGVWNDTGLRLASSSLQLGLNTTLSAISGFIETIDLSGVVGHTQSFLPHTEFSDIDGTRFTHAARVKSIETFPVFSTAVSEIIGKTIGINLGISPSRIIEQSIHEVGTVGASAEVIVKFFKGTDNTGVLFDRKTLPVSDLIANTTLNINYGQDLGFQEGQNIFQEFTSTANFSLKTDSGGNPLTSHLGHELGELALISENILYDNNLDHILDIDINPVYENQF